MNKDNIKTKSNTSFISKIVPWGNSNGLRLSKEVLRLSGMSVGDKVSLTVTDKNQIIIEHLPTADDGSLAYLFRNYKPDGKRVPLTYFGEPVGNEFGANL